MPPQIGLLCLQQASSSLLARILDTSTVSSQSYICSHCIAYRSSVKDYDTVFWSMYVTTTAPKLLLKLTHTVPAFEVSGGSRARFRRVWFCNPYWRFLVQERIFVAGKPESSFVRNPTWLKILFIKKTMRLISDASVSILCFPWFITIGLCSD